jgi:phage/plasmid primase-like uncharacterized protein
MSAAIHEIKSAANGEWNGPLIDAVLPDDSLQQGGHPCPRCGGVDRFGIAKDSRINGYGIWLHQKSN